MNKTTIQNIVSKLIQLEESKIVDQANKIINPQQQKNHESPYYSASKVLKHLANQAWLERGEDDPDYITYEFHSAMLESPHPGDHLDSAKMIKKHDTAVRDNILDIIHVNSSRKHSKDYHKMAGFSEDND